MERLEAMLSRATNPVNEEIDIAALDAFASIILEDESNLALPATKLIITKVHSSKVKEALLALDFLEECMDCCGSRFVSEVGKFKFLNEIIKLVSKKHLGDKTPKEIQNKILDILFTWTTKYQSEPKIKEAYDMLKTQGIVHQPTRNVLPNQANAAARQLEKKSNVDVRELRLKKLINSKNPKDIEQANLLIQNIVREDERRAQIKVRRTMELKKVAENISLLNEMIDNYDVKSTSNEELALIHELNDSCQNFKPMVFKLIAEYEQGGEELAKVLEVNDLLVNILDKYNRIVKEGQKLDNNYTLASAQSGMLDDILGLDLPKVENNLTKDNVLKELGDIFSKPLENTNTISKPAVLPENGKSNILLPQKISPVSTFNAFGSRKEVSEAESKYKALSSLEMKPSTAGISSQDSKTKSLQLDLDSLILGMKSKLMPQNSPENPSPNGLKTDDSKDDALLLDTKSTKSNDDDDVILADPPTATPNLITTATEELVKPEKEFKSLAEIKIDLEKITPSKEPPRTIMDEPQGLKIMMNFAKDHPRPDVTVIVISTINQGKQGIREFQMDASVKKPCKVRLLPASGNFLPGVKPFRSQTDDIIQVLLVSNPTEKPINLTCILSYSVDDDPDPVKDLIEVKNVPYSCD